MKVMAVLLLSLSAFLMVPIVLASVTLHDYLRNQNTADLGAARNYIRALPANATTADVWPTGAPVFLHHILNLYRLTPSSKMQTELVEFAIECISANFANANEMSGLEPPLFVKALMIKELKLASTVVAASGAAIEEYLSAVAYLDPDSDDAVVAATQARIDWLLRFFNILYGLPSEPVPLSKLLLHADTVIHRSAGDLSFDDARKMLHGATVSGQVSVKPADLDALSESYLLLIRRLGITNGGMQLKLLDAITVLDEAAASVHGSFISALLGTPLSVAAAANDDFMELTSWRVMQIQRWFHILATADSATGRNLFHSLALSGAAKMLQQITSLIDILHNWVRVASSAPIDGASQLAMICRSVAVALTTTDYRKHSPVSYAFYRFRRMISSEIMSDEHSSEAPIISALRELIGTLESISKELGLEGVDADVDALRAHFLRHQNVHAESDKLESPKLHPTPPQRAMDVEEAVAGDDGGWPSAALEYEEIINTTRCDIEEVWGLSELPSNKQFFEQYVNRGKPVIFRSVGGDIPQLTSKNRIRYSVSATQNALRRDVFLRDFGAFEVPSSPIPYASSFGFKTEVKPLSDVIHSVIAAPAEYGVAVDGVSRNASTIPMYTFCTPSAQWSHKLLRKVPVPRPISRRLGAAEEDSGVGAVNADSDSWNFEIQFYLGPAGSGAPVHYHGHAINTMAYGEKVRH